MPPSTSQVSAAADQSVPVAHVYQCITSDTTFTKLGYIAGVKEGSVPFYSSATGRFYVNLIGFRGGQGQVNVSTGTTGSASVLVDITTGQTLASFAPPQRFRVSAAIGEYAPDASYLHSSDTFGYFNNNKSPAYKPAISGQKVLCGLGQIGTLAVRQYSMNLLTAYDPQATTFSNDMYSGGIVGRYDGYSPSEPSFVYGPSIYAIDVGGGSLAAGTYSYVAVWTYRDKESKLHFSRISEPVQIVTSGGTSIVKVDVSSPGIGSSTGQLTMQLYRTTSGGTQYYRVASKTVSSTPTTSVASSPTQETYITFSDQLSDATLQNNALLFRQPGTVGTPLDRVAPLSGCHVLRHKDRVFYAHENTVYYSSFDVDGEAPWFSPGLSFDVLGGSGAIVGLASMDGSIIIFKRDAIFVVDGDGPPENGGAGNEYTPPRRIQGEFGCVDQRSIVAVPDGIMYRSQLGIEMLNRGFHTSWIGWRIQNTVNQYAYTGGSTFDRKTGRVHFVLSNTKTTDGGLDYTQPGVVIVYDTVTDAWTRYFYTNTNAYGKAMQDVCFTQATSGGNMLDTCYLADHNNGVFYESETSGLDAGGAFVPWTIATGWVRSQSKQDRIRVSDIQFLGRWISGFNLTCSFLYNYNRGSTTAIKTFDATGTNLTPVQLEFQPSKEQVQSMKFVLTSATPTNPTTLGSGQQLEINGITIRVAPRGGGAKLPVAQKG
jgi:hypothetical protein